MPNCRTHSAIHPGKRQPERNGRRPARLQASAAGAAVAALALICGACSSNAASSSASGPSGLVPSLTIMPSPNGPFSDNFNPYSSTSQATGDGGISMIYEPLLQFNLLKTNDITPWLATGYTFSNGGKTLTFDLRKGVKFSDGTPMTSADVAFTYNMITGHPAINTTGLDPTSVTAPTPTTVVLNFKAPEYTNLINYAQISVVPEHLWKSVNPVTFANTKPVGTGPFTLESFSSQSYTLKRNPDYWQPNEPKIERLVYPGYDSNSAALSNFTAADWSGLFEPNVQKLYVDPAPTSHHYWFAPIASNVLLPNLDKYPLNLVNVRKAISLALDRQTINKDGEDGYEPAVTNLAGIIPTQANQLDTSIPGLTPAQNVSEAKSLLAAAGLKKGANGFLEGANGTPIKLTLVVPSPFTDWVADTTPISQELQAVGLDVTVEGVAVANWVSDMATGNFDLTINGGSAGPTAYQEYNNWLNSAFSAPLGKTATSNYERFNSPAADADLAAYASTNDPAAQAKALDKLEAIVVGQLPVIPIIYGVAWDEYSSGSVTGWPSAANPYEAAAPYVRPGDEMIILHLRPAK